MNNTSILDKQRNIIRNKLQDIFEEISLNEILLTKLREHSAFVCHNLNYVRPAENSFMIFTEANTLLSKYVQVLLEVNCKLEILISGEIKKWNEIFVTNQPPGMDATPLSSTQAQSFIRTNPDIPSLSVPKTKAYCRLVETKQSDESSEKSGGHSNVLTKKTDDTSETITSKTDETDVINLSKSIKKSKKQIKALDFKKVPNTKYSGHVQYSVSPSEIYVYFLVEEMSSMELCDKELSAYYNGIINSKHKPIESPEEYGLLYSESDKLCYRVQVKNWIGNHSKRLKVFLLDHGKTENVSLSQLYPMPNSLKKYPAFAVKCHLTGIDKSITWDQKVLNFFDEWLKSNETVIIMIEKDEHGSLPILVYDESEAVCLNVLLKKQMGDNDDHGRVPDDWDPMREAFESDVNTYDLDIFDPSATIYGYVGKDHERICKLYRDTGKCFKGVSCRKEHVSPDPKGFTTDREEVFVDAFNTLALPDTNQERDVKVTSIQSATKFYCVIHPTEGTEEETLLSLMAYMNEKKNVSAMKKLVVPPSVGQVVIGKFSEDNAWYRAKVLEVMPEKNECRLLFVDYGNKEVVSFSSIRAIEPRYLHLPFQAIFCEIYGISEKPDSLMECVKYLDEVLSGKSRIRIVAAIPGNAAHIIVRLYSSDGADIAKCLLKKGLVARKDHIIIHESETIIPG